MIANPNASVLNAYVILTGSNPSATSYAGNVGLLNANGEDAYIASLEENFADLSDFAMGAQVLRGLGIEGIFTTAQAEAFFAANAGNRVKATLDLANVLSNYSGTDALIQSAKTAYNSKVEAASEYASDPENTEDEAIVGGSVQTFTLTEALAAEELPEEYFLSGASADLGELTVAAQATAADNAASVVAGASNAADLTLSASYTLADTLANLSAADAAVLAGGAYSLTDVAGSLGVLSAAQQALVALASNESSYSFLTSVGGFTTAATDIVNGTASNDSFDGVSVRNTVQTGDIVLDNSLTDSDVLNMLTTSSTQAPRISGVESINVTGDLVSSGMSLANVSNTQMVTLSTKLPGGTATITNANSVNSVGITAGTNIQTLNVTSLASGTRDTVSVDAGAATAITVTGNANGPDLYNVTVPNAATLTLATVGANDNVTVNTSGSTLNLTSVAALEDLTINASADIEVSVTTGLAADTVVTGTGDVELNLTGAIANGIGITSSGSGTLTVDLTTPVTADLYNEIVADRALLGAAAGAATLTFHEVTTVVLDEAAAGALTLQVENAAANITTGTLMVEVAQTQTADLITSDNVDTLIVSAVADAAADTANGAILTLAKITNDAATTTIVFMGSEDLVVTLLDNNAGDVVTAAAMTGKLTISDTSAASTIYLGSGNDTITDTIDAAITTVWAGAGNDTITTGTGDNVVNGQAGNDTITTNIGSDTIDGGDGDDIITVSTGADVVTTGAGADQIRLAVDDAVDTTDTLRVTDFVLGTDLLVLTGTTTDTTIDVTSVTPASGVYTIATGDFVVTLTGNTATDLSGSVQLGRADNAVLTLADTSTVVAGDFNDHIALAAASSATVTGGAGADTFYKDAGAGVLTVSDFAVGTDKIVLTGTSTAGVNLSTAKAPATGAYTDIEAGVFDFTLTGITATDVSNIVQLGSTNQAFTATTATTIVGGDFDDNITVPAAGAVVITGGLGADIITLSTETAGSTINFNAGDSTISTWDQITGLKTVAGATAGTLNLPSANIGSVFLNTQVGDITGITVSSGVITAWAGIDNTINAATLTDALSFLAANVGGTDTVAFLYTADENGDGDTTDAGEVSTFVFQSGAIDTVVELIGTTGITALGTAAGANTILIA